MKVDITSNSTGIGFEEWIAKMPYIDKEKRDNVSTITVDFGMKTVITVFMNKDRRLKTPSSATYYLVRYGLRLFDRNDIKTIGEEIRRIYEIGDPIKLQTMMALCREMLPYTLLVRTIKIPTRITSTIAGRISEISMYLDLKQSEISFHSALYAITQCPAWVPKNYIDIYNREIENFKAYLDRKLKVLRAIQ